MENRPSYLESSNTVNLKLYGRLGFRVATRIQLLRGEKPIDMDVMTRSPPPVATRQLVGETEGV